ncbi:hypothetical protein [Natrialba sp. INN-245]|uniref:DUF7346 family protein n=1 Tax=Natrialba sp. INN-245 TaxID=2690967 RepID=UPI0013116B76|nr:hypothetical protein [Natrialba sp. INN-245]MWV38328.1 hypothetical protein [Natrialba sp. INN-245]
MKTVQDDTGKRYLLLKRSEHASLVRDPQNGNECYVQNDRLESIDGTGTLEATAWTISEPVRTFLTTVHDEETLGLLLELDDRGPLRVKTLLDNYDLCESDLHGRLTVLTTADLLEEVDVSGERGYRLTERCETALESILAAEGRQSQPATRVEGES